MTGSGTGPLTPEVLVPRLGEYLVEKDRITPEQLSIALQRQAELRRSNRKRLIGQILVDLGYIDREALDVATTELLIQLRSALEGANLQLERRVKERTQELENALNQLSSLNELKANLVANISHELRTPLTHLSGYLDLLINRDLGPLTSDQANALEIMLHASERLGHLIEDLIQFSVSERSQVYLTIAPCNLSEMLRSVYTRNISKAHDRQVKLDLQAPEDDVRVDADPEKISWVLMQLLDNAIKFTPSAGSVRLIATREENFVRLEVHDTGIGIPTERIGQIFDPFFQLDGSSTRKAGGTGLGLALARRIVEAHGSVIHVYSEVGKGSRFTFMLKASAG
jgi:two-component system sensor histidine kinase BarA